jgi:hypothetical protein
MIAFIVSCYLQILFMNTSIKEVEHEIFFGFQHFIFNVGICDLVNVTTQSIIFFHFITPKKLNIFFSIFSCPSLL